MGDDGRLEDGFGAAAPVGDNASNDFLQGMVAAFLDTAAARGDRIEESDDLAMYDSASPSPFGNGALLRRATAEAEWPALLARMQAFFGGHDGGPFLLCSAAPTPDLARHGLTPVGHPPLMYRPAGPLPDEPVAGLEIREATDAAGAADWERTVVEAFPLPGLVPYEPGRFMPPRAFEATGWHHWVGYLDGAAVATSCAYVCVRPRPRRVHLDATRGPGPRGRAGDHGGRDDGGPRAPGDAHLE